MQLYNYFRSSASFRVRIALNYKQLEYTTTEISLIDNGQKTTEYLAKNPAGRVPTLEDNGYLIHQSLAIIEYLDTQYPPHPLLPKEPVACAYVREIALSIACDIHPLNNLSVLNYLTKTLKHTEEEKLEWYRHWINEGLCALELIIANNKYYTKKYCHGDNFSMADICLVAQLYNAKRFNCNLDNFPTILKIEEHCLMLEAVQKSYP
ncbi:MAG: maleylacetoacetate isomerase [Burkholderiales bacterium]|nr:maleylacetoacetate isomerase [Burkholderiales bacterium]